MKFHEEKILMTSRIIDDLENLTFKELKKVSDFIVFDLENDRNDKK